MSIRRYSLWISLALLSLLVIPIQAQELDVDTYSFDETNRIFMFYRPDDAPADAELPLVIALHGRPDTPAGIAAITEFHQLAQREGFMVLYPSYDALSWNYTRDLPYYEIKETHDDAVFLRELIDYIDETSPVDYSRIYITGFSNGGFMTQRLACESSDLYAAAAVVGATAFFGLEDICEDQDPMPLLFIQGTEDVSIPWEGIPFRLENGVQMYLYAPVPNTMSFWARHNQCEETFAREEIPPAETETSVTRFVYSCPDESPLVFYGILGGGHNWPGVPGVIPQQIAGEVNTDIHASDEIWAFFENYTREEIAQ